MKSTILPFNNLNTFVPIPTAPVKVIGVPMLISSFCEIFDPSLRFVSIVNDLM
ncbi:hypothetical protein C8N25_10681 [Algoriphagus antarcticus]|uniref:Uncharacterized protein n=1 Tax=Algoriphagus antarcticus TaxID=238540 RepID=A0A3E0DYP8_9BACT|nr:hypothetical protein C8N25_10681 [Algoriphagus antarcticus]